MAEPEATAPGRELADALVRVGKLTTSAWVHAFTHVPRHRFLPRIYASQPHGGFTLAKAGDPGWIDLVYQDEAWVTQIDGGFPDPDETGLVHGQPTSSSSAPGLMAAMLEALDLRTGQRVMEVGTGTGYNAALLCHRTTAENVTSVDFDPRLVEHARTRLAEIGYFPALHTADGAAGYPPRAPYERVIVTCGLPAPPGELIRQTAAGGKLVIPLFRSHLPAGVILSFEAEEGLHAHGKVLEQFGGFMPTRAASPPQATALLSRHQSKQGSTRQTDLTGNPVYEGAPWAWFAALVVPDAASMMTLNNDGAVRHWMLTEDSWGYLADDGHVVQGGPRRIWDEIEAARDEWHRLGAPGRDDFHLTADSNGARLHLNASEPMSWPI